ncbi:MAG: NAD(P)/FAD-dependent oxidoreductase [Rickettsiales bacterium]
MSSWLGRVAIIYDAAIILRMHYDVIIIGTGAAGLMAAIHAGKRGRKVLILGNTANLGEKIRISGGGRCNFTNLNASPKNYLSNNPHFAISALSRFTQHDFIKLVESHKINYHEKTLGQLFCDGSSKQIINLLHEECQKVGVTIKLNYHIKNVSKGINFAVDAFTSDSLIIATGGLAIPKLGATDFGYRIAKQFGLNIITPSPALVPLTVGKEDLPFYESLSGVAVPSVVSYGKTTFRENILFTHRGLSGPAILQISSYLEKPIDNITINLLPDLNLNVLFAQEKNSKILASNFLKEYLPNRFIDNWGAHNLENKKLTDYKLKSLEQIAQHLHQFKVAVHGNEGYAKAEVTAGGVDTQELSSKTMEAKKVPGLYFIGEVVDVTGWLGGYNFQWAWSSGFVAGSFA